MATARMGSLLVALWLLCLVFPVKSQQPLVGLIQGAVEDEQTAPIPDAILTATNIDSIPLQSDSMNTGTDGWGFYQFVNVPMGRYSIMVKKEGYRDYSVPLVTVYPGQTVSMRQIKMSYAQPD